MDFPTLGLKTAVLIFDKTNFRESSPACLSVFPKSELKPEFGRFRQTKSSQLFDYQRVQSFFKLLSCVHARACL